MGTDAKAVVRLSIDERLMLEKLLREPRMAKDRVLRINMLLKSDADGPQWPDSKIAEAFNVSTDTVARLRQRCVFEGLEAATARRRPAVTRTRRRKRGWCCWPVRLHLMAARRGPCNCLPTSSWR